MKELRALTPEEFERAAERLRNPKPGSRIEAAKRFGIDLTLVMRHLRQTPDERARGTEDASRAIAELRGKALRRS